MTQSCYRRLRRRSEGAERRGPGAADYAYARACEPALRVIDAWNAEENTHLRAVNAMLGFEPVDRRSDFQLAVPST